MRKAIVIVGANASGKSALAVKLAQRFNGEVISADSRQVYRGFDLSSGKISKKEMRGIPHHMLDVADPKDRFTAADFKALGTQALIDIWKRKKVPIIVGGTGFYIDALLSRSPIAQIPPDEELRVKFESETTEGLFAQLEKLDPDRASALKEKNEHSLRRRIIRALEVAHSSTPQEPKVSDALIFQDEDIFWIGLQRTDEDLKQRILERILERIRQGMIDEVRTLHENGLSWERMEELGLEYRYLARYLQGEISKEAMLLELEKKTWQYAKRQRTWFKRNKEIMWFTSEETNSISTRVEKFLDN